MEIKYPDSYVVWDLETTGFSPTSCKILEIACLMVENGKEVGAYSALLNHKGLEIPEDAFKVHGISSKMCEMEGKDPEVVLFDVLNIFAKYEAHLTHNGIKFDVPFMIEFIKQSSALKNLGPEAEQVAIDFLNHKAMDTAVLAKAKKLNMTRYHDENFKEFAERVMNFRAYGVKYNLGVMCDELGIDRSKVTQHRAVADVFLTNEIYKVLKAIKI